MIQKKFLFLMFFFFLGLFSRGVLAGGFYMEVGIGGSQFWNPGPGFEGDLPVLSTPSLAGNIAFIQNLSRDYSNFQFQIGTKGRMASSNAGGQNLGLASIYPIYFRIETFRLYWGFSVTPFVWRSLGGFGAFEPPGKPNFAGLGEVGTMWKVTPDFYLEIEGAAQLLKSSGGIGPMSLEATVQMRFYFDSDFGNQSRYEGFDGWRYPFGIEIHRRD